MLESKEFMKLFITVKMAPESKEELTNTFPSQVHEVKNHFEEMKKEAFLGPLENVELRFLVGCEVVGIIGEETQHANDGN
jgi:hypothetical protein